MIWIILAALGVPLWLCAAAITTLLLRNRSLRQRGGDIPVRRRIAGSERWTRGHAIWVHDVFAFRGSPAMWSESLLWVTATSTRTPDGADDLKKLRRLGDQPTIVTMTDDDGSTVEFAVPADRTIDLLGPFADLAVSGARTPVG